MDVWEKSLRTYVFPYPINSVIVQALRSQIRLQINIGSFCPQVAQAHYESPEQHYPTLLINYSYSKKIMRRCMEKYFFLTKLAKCTLNITLKLTFSVFLFFFVF